MRAEFPKSVRRAAFVRAEGKCELCGCGLKYGEAEFHHKVEAFLGGEATLENCVVLDRHCHALATKERRPEIDKTRRISDKRMNIRRKSTMPGSRGTKYKKLLNGGTVLR
jgi:5-methylcytosine-specific restriction endonuclease McrA